MTYIEWINKYNLPTYWFFIVYYIKIKIIFQSKSCTGMSIESMFEDPLFREAIHDTFLKDGFIMCEGFFKSKMVEFISNEVFSNDLEWKEKGPLNKRYYLLIAIYC